ncbi:MAG: glycine-rich domain-containing protein [Bdellovibrio sp.]
MTINIYSSHKGIDVDVSIDIIRKELLEISLKDNEAWANTINDSFNTTMSCLSSGISCCDPSITDHCSPLGGDFRLNDRYNKIFYDPKSSTTAGFDSIGNVCNNFNSLIGNASCPFRVTLNWQAVCKTPCVDPQILLIYKFEYKPGLTLSKVNINYNKVNIKIIRDKIVSGSSMSFTQSQVFDANGTFTTPANVNFLMIEAWGGGGAGAWGDVKDLPAVYDATNTHIVTPKTTFQLAGGGGGGGGYIKSVYMVSPNTTYHIQVGNGGDPFSTDINLKNGGNSSVDIIGFVAAPGGKVGVDCNDLDTTLVSTDYTACLGTEGTGGAGGLFSGGETGDTAVGQTGGSYSEVFSKWYHPPSSSTTEDDYWQVAFAGGSGGAAGGNGGRGASCDRENLEASPATSPGGGGAGVAGPKVATQSEVPMFAYGAKGRVIIWW